MNDLRLHRAAAQPFTGPDGNLAGTWRRLLADDEVTQLSLQVVPPRTYLGHELHGERDEWHTCLQGELLVAQAGSGALATSAADPAVIHVPALVAHGLFNGGDVDALVLIASTQAHQRDDDRWWLSVPPAEIAHLCALWQDYFGKDE